MRASVPHDISTESHDLIFFSLTVVLLFSSMSVLNKQASMTDYKERRDQLGEGGEASYGGTQTKRGPDKLWPVIYNPHHLLHGAMVLIHVLSGIW